MKYNSILSLIILSVCMSAWLAGCQALQNLTDAQKPNLSVKNVRVTDFAFDEIELTFDINVENPNPFALHLLSYDYGFNINGNTFVDGTRDKGLDIEASGTSVIHVPIQLNFVELYNLFGSLKGEDNADYELSADLTFNLPVLGETTLPLKKSGTIPMLQLPKVSVAGLQVKDLSLTNTDLELRIKIQNPNGFGLLLNHLSYQLSVNNKEWLNTELDNENELLSVNENSSTYIVIPISLNTLNVGTSLINIINNAGDLKYSLKGSLDISAEHPLLGDTDFSFFESGLLPVIMQ